MSNTMHSFERSDIRYWLVMEGMSIKAASHYYYLTLEEKRNYEMGLRDLGHADYERIGRALEGFYEYTNDV